MPAEPAAAPAAPQSRRLPPQHRPAPRNTTVQHRVPPKLAGAAARKNKPPWQDDWATSTWPNWQPARPNAPVATYDQHEAARAGIRLMPDQGSLIAGLKLRVVELEGRQSRLDSQLRLQQQIKALRRENARLREQCSQPAVAEAQAQVQLHKSENSTLRSQNLALAAQLHRVEKKLKELGVDEY